MHDGKSLAPYEQFIQPVYWSLHCLQLNALEAILNSFLQCYTFLNTLYKTSLLNIYINMDSLVRKLVGIPI